MDTTRELHSKKFSARQLVARVFETDQYLIRQILEQDDKEAASVLIERYYKTVYREIYIKTSDEELSLDLTQETFIAVLRALPQFDDKKASFKTWITRIAQNNVIDYRRSRQNHEALMTDVLEGYDRAANDNIEENVLNRIANEKVKSILETQDKELQTIFIMKAQEGYTFSEISQKTGISVGVAKNRYYKFVKEVRKEMHEYE